MHARTPVLYTLTCCDKACMRLCASLSCVCATDLCQCLHAVIHICTCKEMPYVPNASRAIIWLHCLPLSMRSMALLFMYADLSCPRLWWSLCHSIMPAHCPGSSILFHFAHQGRPWFWNPQHFGILDIYFDWRVHVAGACHVASGTSNIPAPASCNST